MFDCAKGCSAANSEKVQPCCLRSASGKCTTICCDSAQNALSLIHMIAGSRRDDACVQRVEEKVKSKVTAKSNRVEVNTNLSRQSEPCIMEKVSG